MSDSDSLKRQLRTLAEKIGPDQLKRQLVIEGFGFSTAEKVANGTYVSELGHRLTRGARAVLAKHGEALAS